MVQIAALRPRLTFIGPTMKSHIDPALLFADNYQHTTIQETQFGDVDVLGHVNNLAVSRYYESARARWQMTFFGERLYQSDNPIKIVLAQAKTHYIDEIHFPESLQLTTGISHIGNSSYVCSQAIFRGQQAIGYCEAVLVHTINGQSTPLANQTKDKMLPYFIKNLTS